MLGRVGRHHQRRWPTLGAPRWVVGCDYLVEHGRGDDADLKADPRRGPRTRWAGARRLSMRRSHGGRIRRIELWFARYLARRYGGRWRQVEGPQLRLFAEAAPR